MSFSSSTGHPNSEQSARIGVLETKLADNAISVDELFELAFLSLEPAHDGFRAADLLARILTINPRDNLAKVWLAHCWIYEFMDEESLQRAVDLCDDVERNSDADELRAAATTLKGAALHQLSSPADARIALEVSIKLAPSWITNRQLLASLYEKEGRRDAAEEQLQRALHNSSQPPVRADSLGTALFELLITGRGTHGTANLITDQLRRLAQRDS